jgi:hypothetical protein
MKVGIIGGTGNMGRGLTIRLALRHDILVGSRSLEKARKIAKNLKNVARGFYLSEFEGSITGVLNADAIESSEVVIVCLPAKYSLSTLKGLRGHLTSEKVVVSTVVPMTRKEKLFYWTPLEEGGTRVSGSAPHLSRSRRSWPPPPWSPRSRRCPPPT